MRALLLSLAALALAAPGALAATVSGQLAYCDTGDECRYFPDPRLEVTYLAAPGEENELRVLPHPDGVRLTGTAPIAAGESCTAVNDHDVRCGPPAPAGLVVFVRTGDANDSVFARFGSVVELERGDDVGRGTGTFSGGPGRDDLRASLGAASLYGGQGEDVLVGRSDDDLLDGGPGPDLLVGGHGSDDLAGGRGNDELAGGFGTDTIEGGPGNDLIRATDGDRDTIRCGRGADRAYVDRGDRLKGCEHAGLGWPR